MVQQQDENALYCGYRDEPKWEGVSLPLPSL
jgi:hypothetical protein